MKQLMLVFLLSILVTACDFLSGGEDNSRMDFDIEASILVNVNDKLSETSGLIWFNEKMWSLNDSGGENEIYALNQDGDVVLTVELEGASNTDWEAMTQDESYIYVGDFGNNTGDRTNLKVYKILKDDLDFGNDRITVVAEEIKFSYADQDDFSSREYSHEFDCEAMFSFQDHIYLLSKDWRNFKTSIYKLPKESGQYELTASDSYNVNGLITDADLSPDGNYLALLGYSVSIFNLKDLKPFIYLFKFDSAKPFGDKTVFLNLNTIVGAQTEGIAFLNDTTLAFSTEKTSAYSQQVFSIDWSSYKKYLD